MWRGSRQQRTRTRSTLAASPKRQSARVQLTKSKIAQQRVKKRLLLVGLALVVTVSFIGAVSWLSFLDVFAVQRIAVAGVEEVRPTAIESELLLATAAAHFGLFSQQNMLLYPRAELEQQLLTTFPRLHTVSIDRQFTQHAVLVAVEEREIYGRWCQATPQPELVCYHIDHTGVIFEPANATSIDTIIFIGGLRESRADPLRAEVSPEHFEQVVTLLEALQKMSLQPAQVILTGDDAIISLIPSWELRVALDKDVGAAAFNLRAVLDEHGLREDLATLEYIDMRFDERVYFKHRDSAAEVADNSE